MSEIRATKHTSAEWVARGSKETIAVRSKFSAANATSVHLLTICFTGPAFVCIEAGIASRRACSVSLATNPNGKTPTTHEHDFEIDAKVVGTTIAVGTTCDCHRRARRCQETHTNSKLNGNKRANLRLLRLKNKMGITSPSHVSELKAVMSIRRFRQDLDRNFGQMIEVESKINRLNNRASGVAFNTDNASSVANWKSKLININESIESIKRILADGKRRVEYKDRSDSSGMWIEFDAVMTRLEKELEDLAQMGVDVLPQNESADWQREMRDSEGVFLPMLVAYADACRVELLLLEKYSEEELMTINEFIHSKTPSDFSDEEAEQYEIDYKSAVADFIHECDHGKNLWDRFLDILAGGTHQLPSERVMFERWIVGEKRDL